MMIVDSTTAVGLKRTEVEISAPGGAPTAVGAVIWPSRIAGDGKAGASSRKQLSYRVAGLSPFGVASAERPAQGFALLLDCACHSSLTAWQSSTYRLFMPRRRVAYVIR